MGRREKIFQMYRISDLLTAQFKLEGGVVVFQQAAIIVTDRALSLGSTLSIFYFFIDLPPKLFLLVLRQLSISIRLPF